MIPLRAFLLVLTLSALSHPVMAQTATPTSFLDPEVQRILSLSDARDEQAMMNLLGTNPKYDALVMRRIASLQPKQQVFVIITMLNHSDPEARKAAAFAAGLCITPPATEGDGEYAAFETMMQAVISNEKEPEVRAAQIDGFSRMGSVKGLQWLAGQSFPDEPSRRAQALGIARFAIRKITSPAATSKVNELFTQLRHPSRFNEAAYAWMRIADGKLLEFSVPLMLQALSSPNPFQRMHAAGALGKINQGPTVDALMTAARDKDWRVAVNALRSLGQIRMEGARQEKVDQLLRASLSSKNPHIVKTALNAIRAKSMHDKPTVNAVLALASATVSEDLKEEAIVTLAAVTPSSTAEDLVRNHAKLPRINAGILRAIGVIVQAEHGPRDTLVALLRAHLTDSSTTVASAAIESYGFCLRFAEEDKQSGMRRDLVAALQHFSAPGSRHGGPVQFVIDAFVDSTQFPQDYGQALREALTRFSSPGDVETRIALARTLARMRDEDSRAALRALLQDPVFQVRQTAWNLLRLHGENLPAPSTVASASPAPDWARLAAMKNPSVTVKTSRGNFTLQLFPDLAPYTVWAFLKMVEKGFYNGLTFHRVVPNFVAQGGDPEGDGSGGPDFTLRSEFSPGSFLTGDLGMASSGKDTEGCQFFIMHSPHPHLDGKYTRFGRVTSGMKVVESLEIGDRILTMTVNP